ncbi:hypothetical protein M407DRAFT_25456 [Tulasnella calospora MUT 4182]|uniref:AB hydrolase-1 domain-containing protein n=1 Tax=Tulasnella calospora MUT 4182 TaxID=1051891 RepID=A0A0C3Q6Y3_9AGAM|nr:hypothetical protein M407DRAFT_25456 [Tulasnella calospora MUT 4182]
MQSPSSSLIPHEAQQLLVTTFSSFSSTLCAGYDTPFGHDGISQAVASSLRHEHRAFPAQSDKTCFLEFGDGGNAQVQVYAGDDAPEDVPTFIGVHGMAGDFNAPYLHEIFSPLVKENRGRGIVFNLCGCGEFAASSPAFHHGGSTSDLGAVVAWVTMKWPKARSILLYEATVESTLAVIDCQIPEARVDYPMPSRYHLRRLNFQTLAQWLNAPPSKRPHYPASKIIVTSDGSDLRLYCRRTGSDGTVNNYHLAVTSLVNAHKATTEKLQKEEEKSQTLRKMNEKAHQELVKLDKASSGSRPGSDQELHGSKVDSLLLYRRRLKSTSPLSDSGSTLDSTATIIINSFDVHQPRPSSSSLQREASTEQSRIGQPVAVYSPFSRNHQPGSPGDGSIQP